MTPPRVATPDRLVAAFVRLCVAITFSVNHLPHESATCDANLSERQGGNIGLALRDEKASWCTPGLLVQSRA